MREPVRVEEIGRGVGAWERRDRAGRHARYILNSKYAIRKDEKELKQNHLVSSSKCECSMNNMR